MRVDGFDISFAGIGFNHQSLPLRDVVSGYIFQNFIPKVRQNFSGDNSFFTFESGFFYAWNNIFQISCYKIRKSNASTNSKRIFKITFPIVGFSACSKIFTFTCFFTLPVCIRNIGKPRFIWIYWICLFYNSHFSLLLSIS